MKILGGTRLIATMVVLYMLLALCWWSILLYQKNQQYFDASLEVLQLKHEANPSVLNESLIENQREKYKRQKAMILGEGLVFGLMLITGIFLIFRSSKKELENARNQNNFMLSVTHELKSPIASIKLILDTFKKRTLSTEQVQELTSHALEENERLARLVDNVLFANKMNQRYNFNFEFANLNNLLIALLIQYRKNHPSFEFRYDEADVQNTKIDQQAIEIVIRNILDNAIKYSKNKKILLLSIINENKNVLVEVKDFGIGVPSNERQLIFNKFYRIGNEEIRKTQGTGLGLFISQKIMEAHSGTIAITDNPEGGSIFTLKFRADGK